MQIRQLVRAQKPVKHRQVGQNYSKTSAGIC
jgi:hypothetical protein